jgi:hypothetical protein
MKKAPTFARVLNGRGAYDYGLGCVLTSRLLQVVDNAKDRAAVERLRDSRGSEQDMHTALQILARVSRWRSGDFVCGVGVSARLH